MAQKAIRFIVSTFLLITLIAPMVAQANTIFGGTKDSETGEVIGLCLTNPAAPECKGVNCASPEFEKDLKCISEAKAGTALVKNELGSTGITGTDNIGDLIIKAVNFMLPYLSLAAFVGFVVAGFLYVTAFGEEDKLTKAKTILIWSVVGLILVIFSFTIVQFFTSGFLGRL